MKPFKISETSWHYRLTLQFYRDTNRCYDFCSYARRVFWSILIATVFLVIGLYLLFCPLDLGYFIYLQITEGGYKPGGPALIAMVVLILGTIIFTFNYLYDRHRIWKNDRANKKYAQAMKARGEHVVPVPKEPGFLSTWYSTYRGKFCMNIEYTSE
jgi:hypothetical protein